MKIVKNNSNANQNKLQWIIEMTILVVVFAVFAWTTFKGVQENSTDIFSRKSTIETVFLYMGIISGTIPVFYLIFQAIL